MMFFTTIKPVSARRAAIRVLALSSFMLPPLGAYSATLNLSLPKEFIENGRPPAPDEEALVAAGYRAGKTGPAMGLYDDNVQSIIRRRSQGILPKNRQGQVICGLASYKLTIRPDGAIGSLEVMPSFRESGPSRNFESYYMQPTPAFRNEGSAKVRQIVATDKEELGIFAQTIAESIRAAAPFPPHPAQERQENGKDISLNRPPVVLVSGRIGVACTKVETSHGQ